jgi:rhodanese-related sulfurtransferase
MGRHTLQELLADARRRIARYDPADVPPGATIVDIRAAPKEVVPGSLLIPRSVLEWRLDPDSEWRSPHAPDVDDELVLLCDHGESSSLAAATLVDLGFTRAGDVVGGFEAWQAAGLPLVPAPEADGLPGTSPPA